MASVDVDGADMVKNRWYGLSWALGAMLLGAWAVAGCNMAEPGARTVSEAWEEPVSPQPGKPVDWDELETPSPDEADRRRAMPIATVNGRHISRKRMLNLLVRTHGLGVLEQLIALELVRQAAEAEGVAVTPVDIRAEHDRAVARISSPVPAATQPTLGTEARGALLAQILARRGLSREQFDLAMERQACLRKIAAKRLKVSDEQLRVQYEMMYNERVQVRHIQLANWRDVSKVQRLLATGEDFAEAARVHSQNALTASDGGLLPPFSRNQDDVPPELREVAFRLETGQVSNPLRIDRSYHLIKPIQRFKKSKVKFEHVKEFVRLKLTERLLPEVMVRIERDLFDKARGRIVITDPTLRKQFEARYKYARPETAGAGR